MGKVGLGLSVACAAASCTIAAVMVAKRVRSRRRWRRVVRVLEVFEEGCSTSTGRLKHVVDAMAVEMHAGLASEGGSKLKMLLTFIDKLPNGCEKGIYFALHLGGTDYRVLRIELGGERPFILALDVVRQPIPQYLMTGTSQNLFDFIASSLMELVEKEETGSEHLSIRKREVGFTFAFPVKHTSVSSGVLMKWTKGFSIQEMVGKNVAEHLQEALSNKGLGMHVAAVVNDTVGTLAYEHYQDEDTVVAVIIGTGTNACYVEKSDAIIKCQGHLTASRSMVVNMEWGNFWSSHLPRTLYDIDLDADSPNPNDQGFEKMISGMYLGDIVRRVILKMSEESDVFGPISPKLLLPFVLRTKVMAAMHEDSSSGLTEVGNILEDILEIREASLKVRKLVVKVCDVVTRRAARLAAAGIVGILKKMGRDGSGGVSSHHHHHHHQYHQMGKVKLRRTVVAVDGGLYKNYTMFREYLNEALAEILGQEVSRYIILKGTEDGAGIGAALVAASYSSPDVD